MIERRSIVVGDVAEQQSPASGNGIEFLDDDREPVALRLVFGPERSYRVAVELPPSFNVGVKRLRMDYCLRLLEPRTLKGRIVGR
jgi:hypothetical protein